VLTRAIACLSAATIYLHERLGLTTVAARLGRPVPSSNTVDRKAVRDCWRRKVSCVDRVLWCVARLLVDEFAQDKQLGIGAKVVALDLGTRDVKRVAHTKERHRRVSKRSRTLSLLSELDLSA